MRLFSPDHVEELWLSFFERLDELNPIPKNWRSHPVMNAACEFADLATLEKEMKFLVGKYDDFDALIAPNAPTAIHHLFHIARWEDVTKHRITEMESIMEWGGGYGSMARLVRALNPDCKYEIIDYPSMLRFARHFLLQNGIHSHYLGEKPNTPDSILLRDANSFLRPFVVKERNDPLDTNKVTEKLAANPLRNPFKESPDLFLSTWALSESAVWSQVYVMDHSFFRAPSLLLAFNPKAGFVGRDHFNQHINKVPGIRMGCPDGESEYLFR